MANNVEVLLPLMGEGVNEASVTSWLVNEGEFVKEGAPLSKYQPIKLIPKFRLQLRVIL